MFFVGLIVLYLMCEAGFNGINEGLPSRIHTQNFGLVEFLYRAIRFIAPVFFVWVMVAWWYPVIGIALYLLASGLKKLTRKLAYDL